MTDATTSGRYRLIARDTSDMEDHGRNDGDSASRDAQRIGANCDWIAPMDYAIHRADFHAYRMGIDVESLSDDAHYSLVAAFCNGFSDGYRDAWQWED